MENLTFESVLDRIKEQHGLKSDYAVCKAFGLSPQNVSGWRKGRSHPDETMCAILAEAAGLDPLVLAAAMQAQRSKTAQARSMWEQIAERLQMAAQGAVAAVFAVAIAIGLIAQSADDAWAGEVPTPRIEQSAVYISYLVMDQC
ncbi:hypothetical protein [Acidovorax sp. SUPP2825]|uniref:hypothetical protein n=1 Tax=Acidovorax sp. SUPP2825 TaxID=2920879 RepID=UPI0023DE4371|nr:hypothetical protein [Acidovorax sp. SUPP2825]GKS96760.1 hypothetical protein AVAK2825_19515 [Acidovorax sp. SUPP2825]